MTRQDNISQMLTFVEQWQQSGITQAEFAQAHNLTVVKLRYWIRKYRQNEHDSGFIQLNGLSQQGISIRYPNGVELSLPAQTSATVLRSLITI